MNHHISGEKKQETEEHILVCLSASPSNEKIIDTAAKMAHGLQARFTALYVQNGVRQEKADQERLEEHIRFAEKMGAEIVMTHGENVPVQIAEYAQLSGVTTIVIGQSNARKNHVFSRQTLTEKLISLIPDIDIHIIPDTFRDGNYHKLHLALYTEKPSVKDILLTISIFAICTMISLVFQKHHFTDTNIVTIYILGVLLTSILTNGYLCSIAGSFLSVVLFCFFLTEPRMSFQTYAVGYPVTFLIMLISSVLTGTLAAKLKNHARLSAQLAFRAQILFDTDQMLQKTKSSNEILSVTCTQLVRLLNRSIVAYVSENEALSCGTVFHSQKQDEKEEKAKSEEQLLVPSEENVAKWVYENQQRAGATTHHFRNARCLYLAIRIGDHVYGCLLYTSDAADD